LSKQQFFDIEYIPKYREDSFSLNKELALFIVGGRVSLNNGQYLQMFVNLGRIMHCQSLDGINRSGSILKVKGLEKYKGHSRIQSQISASKNSKCCGCDV
jgi:hypothetical protein